MLPWLLSVILVCSAFAIRSLNNKNKNASPKAPEVVAKEPAPNLQHKLYEDVYGTFSDQTTRKTKVLLSELKDKYPIVIVNFWASWCTPCLKEFKGLNQLISKYGKDKIFVVGINQDTENPLKEIAAMEKKFDLQFESISDASNRYQNQFGINALPTTIIFSKGKVIYANYEYTDFLEKSLLAKIDLALSPAK